ncbi:MAG: UDP-N-acetylmuramate dehydrogenase [Alphaproteobacteria bacterium]|nr:UDP-N-acetylmuramate dehydrogenase [Alphaproteobacteria bacterium]
MSRSVAVSTTLPNFALPTVRGRLTARAPTAGHTWFGVGGAADTLFEPADRADLAAFLAALPAGFPITVIGGGANVLVRDGGIAGVTIRLARRLGGLATEGDEIIVGAGARHLSIAHFGAANGIAGLEFLSGIPGTIGGGLRMNAGAYGHEISDVLVSAEALDHAGRQHVILRDAMGFSYRHCAVDSGWVFVEARLRGKRGDPVAIAREMAEIRVMREATQPIRTRTGGSTFKNPPGQSAWRLIDAAGCRGLRRGGAMVSPVHVNFLINTGGATAADLEGLGEEVRRRVFENSGVVLDWEIRRIGRHLPGFEPAAPWDESA